MLNHGVGGGQVVAAHLATCPTLPYGVQVLFVDVIIENLGIVKGFTAVIAQDTRIFWSRLVRMLRMSHQSDLAGEVLVTVVASKPVEHCHFRMSCQRKEDLT